MGPTTDRGNVRFRTRDWSGALSDYRRCCELSKAGQDYPRLYIWLIRARQDEAGDADKELSDYLLQRLKDDKKVAPDDWVAHIGRYLLGNITGPDLFAAAVVPDAKKTSGQHCEAWYYTGMKNLLAGGRQTAADDFRKCIATGENDYVEYGMARSELKALGE